MADQRRDKSRMLKPGASSTRESFKEEIGGIDQNLLEKRLESLRDTQESVQGLSLWCQANKRHSSAIIETWLKILKKSPVEKRLTLFYLANDVVQHAKRKSDAMVVNQWAFAVQKATPQVRIPSSVSTAIARIFKIWEERSVYSKETIADLQLLLRRGDNVPAKERVGEKKKPETYTASADKVAAFQTSTLISKVKLAYRLKSHLGVTFRAKPFVHMDLENLKGSIKDRSHGMEVIQEIGQLVEQLKTSESKLSIEVEERRKIVETAEIAIVHFEIVRGEAKIVNSAYKNFTERVESTKDKVIEKFKSFEEMEIDSSPVPSPPPEAPSPPPDDDDFGINQLQSTSSSTHIRADIVDALKSTMPVQQNNSGGMYQTVNSNAQQQQSSTNSLPAYDQAIPTMAMQQQFQQNWGTSPGNFAAIIQQLIPGANNYLAMQQQQPPLTNAYGTQGYEAPYQHHHHASPPTHLPPDVSSIPLPPSGPDIPPPPQNQTMNSNHHHMSVQNNSINSPVGSNPYLTSYNNSSYDSSSSTPAVDEYVPLPYYKPQQQLQEQNLNSSMNYSSEFDSYNITSANALSTTPTRQGPSRYHPYQHTSDSKSHNNSGGSQHGNSHLVSPAYSNHSGVGPGSMNESSTSRFYGSGCGSSDGGNSTISPPTGRNDNSSFDPMEMFTSALSKNKNNITQGSSQPPPSGDMNMSANSAFNPADSFYSSGNIFDTSFNESNTSNLNGGEDVVPYSPRKPGTGNFFTPHRGAAQHGVLGGNNFSSNNRPPRGHRGGMIGGLQMSRGFSGGFRGRGTPRGPPRGGRGRFQV